jgi:ABC-2 type transport system permease protein
MVSNLPTEGLLVGPASADTSATAAMARANYYRVFATFFRNALVREMTFRGNLIITIMTRTFYFVAQLTLFEIIYRQVVAIDDWTRYEYFAFMATGMLINSLVEAFFMPNCANFSELIRTGNLDFVLLKPIDAQFLVSFEKMELAMLNQAVLALSLVTYALVKIGHPVHPLHAAMYVVFVAVGVGLLYSLMLLLASTSVWFGRNTGLYDFWFYVTIFARYPRGIYGGSPAGETLQFGLTYFVPILLVVTVPSRILLAKVLEPSWLTLVAITSAVIGLAVSRAVFRWSLRSYRSASS